MRFAIPLSILAAALVAGATSGAATAADKADKKPARACFRADDVRTWKFYDHEQHINIVTNRKEVFNADVIGICPSANFSQTLGIKSQLSSFICEGDFAGLFVRDVGEHEHCEMQKIRKLSPDEVAALPKDQKP